MPMYTFYPCRSDGSSSTFEALELDTDIQAKDHAPRLLRQHPTCAFVTVWRGDREVLAPPPWIVAQAD